MKALVVKRPNDKIIDHLQIIDVAKPVPAPNQVLIRVHAVGLNPVDYKVVESGVPAWTYPHTLGLDVAGEIAAVGANVTDWQVGERVSGHGDLAKNGCFAEFVTVPTYQLARIPAEVSYETAASLLCGALTAYTAVERKPNLTNVKTVLIHAGAGGVGSIAIQLAKLHGFRVFTTVSTGKIEYVRQFHPDVIIDYRKENVDDRIEQLTGGSGVDLIIDTVGKAEAERDLRRLAYNGTLVTIVDVPDLTGVPMFDRGLSVDVVNLGGAHHSGNLAQQADLGKMNAEMLNLAAAGKVDPLIEKVISFDQIKAGLQAIKDHQVVGKLVAKIG
ncbi:MAG: zinc-binding dehydrogenase [Limosilactobacillus pontis]|uniref:Alcohol dehydrogenase n=1 Tax=Limosilactobacillus pontis TaxID=35787 RepID=A0A2J6NL65_9LACO|nr:zinc-binding dehydrogenase [Limosilactobacillus pontis]PMB82070.1 alcohol dehydrogenase [Limosilactobacillus pontis]